MKKVLFNLQNIQPEGGIKRHGGGKYGEIVFTAIVEKGLPVVGVYDSKRWINPSILEIISSNSVALYDINQVQICDIIEKEKIDTLYTPLVYKGIINNYGCNIVGTIHGLRELEIPRDKFLKKYRLPFRILRTIKRNFNREPLLLFLRRILPYSYFYPVTVSNHTASAIKVFFPNTCKKIPVFYSPSTSNNIVKETKYTEKYFLLVSASIPYKNNLRAIIALDQLFSKGYLSDFMVKITGVDSPSIYKYKIKNKDRFVFLGYVEDNELSQLYHDTYCFIYPSLTEGFGYPPLEAMCYGKPVLASPFTSITEVLGDAALYFNPFSVEEIMNRILQISQNEIYKEYALKSRDRFCLIKKKQDIDLEELVKYIYSV